MKEQDAQAKLSLKLQAYQYLKTKILNCEYRPNEFLNCLLYTSPSPRDTR